MFRIFSLALGIMVVIFASETNSFTKPNIDSLIQQVVPKGVDIDRHPDARKELMEHLKACGIGVVKGIHAKNRCHYQIRIDDLFLQPLKEKTGFVYDPDWPFQNGIQWMSATQEEMEDIPKQWDISDQGKMIRITRQECGDCWAQASRANVEQLLLTHMGINAPLSTQTLISSCCNTGSCGGGYMSTPEWIVKNGLPILSRDPYLGKNSSCKFKIGVDKMDYHIMKAPNVGSSLQYSRAISPEKRVGPKVRNIQAMMMKYRSSAVVTIQAISQSGGIIKNCSSINAGGNHMQDIVGWYEDEGDNIARVQNSWGTSHGQEGYTHLLWECGEGKFNRGLGRSVRIGIISEPVGCKGLPDAYTGSNQYVSYNEKVQLGRKPRRSQTCEWVPADGLDDPFSCSPKASPAMPTEYHLKAKTDCGEATAMVLVVPKGTEQAGMILTPYGVSKWEIKK